MLFVYYKRYFPFVCFLANAFSENNSSVRPTKRNLQVLAAAHPFSQQLGQCGIPCRNTNAGGVARTGFHASAILVH